MVKINNITVSGQLKKFELYKGAANKNTDLQSMFNLFLVHKFRALNSLLANNAIFRKFLDQCNIARWIEQCGNLTNNCFEEGYNNLIITVIEVHRAYAGSLYVTCYKKECIANVYIIDEDEIPPHH